MPRAPTYCRRMAVTVERYGRDGAPRLVEALQSWAPPGGYFASIHAGDLGWHLRLDDADVHGTFVAVLDDDEPVAIGLLEGSTFRPTIRPDRLHDLDVAAALGDVLRALPADKDAYTDASSESVFRAMLSGEGWELDLDAWPLFYRPLSAADGEHDDPLSHALASAADIADRVAVQRSAFTNSTFTVERWHQMAAGPGFDPAFEFLRRDGDGTPVAAATGWMAGRGKVAILEPVGTNPAYAGRGHGRAVCQAVIAALARGGASGVTVCTPLTNVAAVRAYEACGLRQVELMHALRRPASPS